VEEAMRTGRIDYRMRRRALLRDVTQGLRSPDDVRDAHPDLLRAAQHLGDAASEDCPLCDRGGLRHVTYVFDRHPTRHPGGRAVQASSLALELDRCGELRVFVVEVCPDCAWHHLVESYLLVDRTSIDTG
jgi:hypothetical protein